MTPALGPRRRPRRPALLVPLALAAVLLVGCGDAENEEATSYLVTDLEDGTTAPPTPMSTETTAPEEPAATPDEPPEGTDTPAAPDGSELVARVGGAMGEFSTVALSLGNATPPAVFEMDLDYATGDLALAMTPVDDGAAGLELRRIDDTVYVNPGEGEGWSAVEPDDPRLAETASVIPAVFAFDLLADIRAVLETGDLEPVAGAEIDGAEVDQYRVTLDADDLTQPSLVTQPGRQVDVVVSLEPGGLPRRIDYDIEPGTISRVDFSAWGQDVDVEVPELG